jgi:hypothetical protein
MNISFSFFFVGLFFVSFSLAAVSNTSSVFSLSGCTYVHGESEEGLAADTCSDDGRFYCGPSLEPWHTVPPYLPNLGCARGDDDFDSSTNASCCPSGTYCAKIGENMFQCQDRVIECERIEDPDECRANECVWDDKNERCVEELEYDCGYYETQALCEFDFWHLGQEGVGTEVCGTAIECDGRTFIVSEEDCGCVWDAGECKLRIGAIEMITNVSQTPDNFSCTNTYQLGDCLDGKQDVIWTSENDSDGFPLGVPEECLIALDCLGGEDERFCGAAPVKLPGVSFFSLFVSICLVCIYFLFSNKDRSFFSK